MRKRRTMLRVELLEDRTAPATWGNPWPDPTHLTLSFAPDGTQIGGQVSNLFQTMNAIAPTNVWENAILRAVQTWAAQANINVALVADQGLPFGAAGAIQGDARFGDIRVGAYAMPAGAEAAATPFDLDAGTWSGDMEFNSAAAFGMNGQGAFDLFTVALHEAGHVFGLADNSNPASVMDFQYLGSRTGLGAPDVAALQNIYGGARSLNQPDNNNNFGMATPLNSLTNLDGLLSMSVNSDISSLTDQDFYSFSTLLGLGGVDLTVRTAGISLLTPSATVFDAYGNTIASAVSTDPQQGGFVIHLTNVLPLSTYYIEIESGQQNVFGIGSYALTVSELPFLDWLLGGVTATVSYGAGAAANTLFNSADTNFSFATAKPLPAMTPSNNGSSFDTYRASLNSSSDVDFYTLLAPAAAAGASTDVLTAMVWGLQNDLDPLVKVFDAQHNLLAAQVLVNDGFTNGIQISNAQPGARYYVEVLPSGSSSAQSVGNYVVGVDFSPLPEALQSYAGGTLTPAHPMAIDTLTLANQGQLFHFVLSATTPGSTATAQLQMTIIDVTGHVVFTLLAGTMAPVTGNIILIPGQYTVVFSVTSNTSPLPSLVYLLLGEILTDPQGPQPVDPTADPGNSVNSDPNNQIQWTGGASGGISSQDPTSNPSNGSSNATTVTLYNPGDQANFDGDSVSLALSASDSSNDPLTFSATGLPPGLGIDPDTGTISGDISAGSDVNSPYAVTVVATDSPNNASATQSFNWKVSANPVSMTSPGDQTNYDGDAINLAIAAADSAGNALSFSAADLPAGLSIDPNSGTISGKIAANADSSSPYAVTITATDNTANASTSVTFNWTVNPVVITFYNPGDQTNNAGDTVSLSLTAYASNYAALTFTAANLPPGLTIDSSSGNITGTIASNANNGEPYVVTLTATDPDSGATVSVTFNWTVN